MINQRINNKSPIPWTVYGLLIVFCAPLLVAMLLYVFRHEIQFKHICTGNLYNPPIDSTRLFFYDPNYLGKWQLIDVCYTNKTHTVTHKTMPNAIYTALGKERDRVTVRHLSSIPLQPGGMMIIDPKGWLIVYYPPDAHPKNILKDFKRLLRLSHVR